MFEIKIVKYQWDLECCIKQFETSIRDTGKMILVILVELRLMKKGLNIRRQPFIIAR